MAIADARHLRDLETLCPGNGLLMMEFPARLAHHILRVVVLRRRGRASWGLTLRCTRRTINC